MTTDRLALDLDRPLYDQQPLETDRSYAAFLAYRNLPPATRTLRLAAAEFYDEATTGNVRQMQEWSRINRWQERAHAFDVDEANRLADELRADVVAMRTRHAQIASVALAKVVDKLNNADVASMSWRDMAYMLDIAVKVERLSRGESSTSFDVGVVAGRVAEAERPSRDVLGGLLDALFEAGVVGESLDDHGPIATVHPIDPEQRRGAE